MGFLVLVFAKSRRAGQVVRYQKQNGTAPFREKSNTHAFLNVEGHTRLIFYGNGKFW
jgi:hypothetical protein